jgi:hypothetical protein
MPWDLPTYLTTRLRTLQRAHNFNPEVGAAQVRPKNRADYAVYRELLAIAERAGIQVPSFYDPSGLNPEEHEAARAARPHYVYFFQIEGEPFTWKIGRSLKPVKRKQELQVGNDRLLCERHRVDAGTLANAKLLEKQLKRYFIRYLIRGEWRNLSPELVHTCVQRLRSGEDRSFLTTPLKPPPKGSSVTSSTERSNAPS